MPIPKPNKNESKDDFMDRCMGAMDSEYPDEKQRVAVCAAQFTENKVEEKKVYDIDDVEIFEAGKWNGDEYTEKDLDDIVKSFYEIGGVLKPFVKLGHNEKQKFLKTDGMPAAGWIIGLKRKGRKLLAKFSNVPEKIYFLIKNKAYGRISSEIYWNLKHAGTNYRRALKAVALLGADTPAVGTLDDFINLYTEDMEFDKVEFCNKMEEKDMEDVKKYIEQIDALKTELNELKNEKNKEYELKVNDLETKIKEYSEKEEKNIKQIAELTEKNQELEKEAESSAYAKKEAEIDAYLEKQEKKITPVQVASYKAIAMSDVEMTYTKDGKEVKGTGFDMVKSILDNAVDNVNIEETSRQSDVSDKTYSNNVVNSDDDLDKKVKAYVKEHGVNYAEAYEAIADEEKYGGE